MKELNLTQGSVPKVLLQFAVPFLVANILQALYGGADLFVVGQYDDSAGVAGGGSGRHGECGTPLQVSSSASQQVLPY